MDSTDVLIIGARVAGSALAKLLAESGLKVMLVDRASEAHDVVSTHFMNPRGMTYLRRLGVLERLLSVTPAHEYFEVEVDGIEVGGIANSTDLENRMTAVHPEIEFDCETRYACIRRPLLDSTLMKEAAAAGADLRLSTSLKSFIYDDAGQVCGAFLEGPQGAYEVRAKIVVGADGKRSSCAELLDLEKYEERYACTFACYGYFEDLELPHAILKRRNRLSFAAVPTSYGNTMLLVFGPKNFAPDFAREKEKNFGEAIAYIDEEFSKRVQKARRIEPFRYTVDQGAYLRKPSRAGVPLIGDAYCFKDQCTAAGMTHALRDAFLMFSEITSHFRGEKTMKAALEDFHARRYLDLFRYYEFTCSQAEMNPLRPDEERLYKVVSESQAERNRFVGVYFDIVPVKEFFKPERVEKLVRFAELPVRSEEDLVSQYRNPFSEGIPNLSLEQTCFDYATVSGPDLITRTQPYYEFYRRRENDGVFQYARTLHRFPGTKTELSDDSGRHIEGINFASQDYLGLGQDEEIREAALEALKEFGPHSAGSPMIIGNTLLSKQLEEELKKLTGKEHVILFPTGFAAGMGSILGFVKPEDTIVMDRLTHACLQTGARAATKKIRRYAHLDVEAARAELRQIRSRDRRHGILLITEGLFSMDSDSPNLRAFQEIAREFGATLFVDVAHDLGATGPGGTGQIGLQGMYGEIDLVMGSFSKTFACNGGFLATNSPELIQYLRMYSTPHLFSNALSPLQAGVALKAAKIVLSAKGDRLRRNLMDVVCHFRRELEGHGLKVLGQPSPIVPVHIGSEAEARICHRKMMEKRVAAMIIEYPVVPIGGSRFRLQVMASHTFEEASVAAVKIAEALEEAKLEVQRMERKRIILPIAPVPKNMVLTAP